MPASDTSPMKAFDLREISSDWRLTCPVHGNVTMVIQFNGDWDRTFCQDCFETDLIRGSRKTTLSLNGGPAPTAKN